LMECQRRFNKIYAKNTKCTFIGVHVRRGDFTSEWNANFGFVPASELYLNDAVKYFRKELVSLFLF
jgi:hypothetical protein